MVDIKRGTDGLYHRFVLRPNRSLSWRGVVIFFLSLVLISGTFAIVLAMMGFWLILPFAGIEMLALGAGLYVVACRTYQCEVVSITPDAIRIEKGRRFPRQQWTLTRVWARVILERCPRRWYPSRLLIRSHGRAVEIGQFLDEEERQRLAADLTRSL